MSGGVTRSPRLHFGTGRVYSEEEKVLMERDSINGIGGWLLGWVIVWTKYFKNSVRVRNTFS